MRVVFKSVSSVVAAAWYSITAENARETPDLTRLPRSFVGVGLSPKTSRNQGAGMTIETYRVSANNTSKLSENKIHDDSVARKFGFSGGLVPGVYVFPYMIHIPVRKWGRAFLERGVIETRFVKPVYDGEFADVTATESDGGLTMEGAS